MVLAVLVVLVLINLGLTLYILIQATDYKKMLESEIKHVKWRVDMGENRQNMFEDGIVCSLNKIHKGITNIPKEIAVKNVLSIP